MSYEFWYKTNSKPFSSSDRWSHAMALMLRSCVAFSSPVSDRSLDEMSVASELLFERSVEQLTSSLSPRKCPGYLHDTRSSGHWNSCRSMGHIHDLLLVFRSNYVAILHHFRDIFAYFPKFINVTWPRLRTLEGLFVNPKANTSHGQTVYNIWSL